MCSCGSLDEANQVLYKYLDYDDQKKIEKRKEKMRNKIIVHGVEPKFWTILN